jgi:hypothetical protein
MRAKKRFQKELNNRTEGSRFGEYRVFRTGGFFIPHYIVTKLLVVEPQDATLYSERAFILYATENKKPFLNSRNH